MIKHIALWFLVVHSMLFAQDVNDVLNRVESAFKKSKILKIKFAETYIWQLTGEENTITGSLIMKGDDRFHIETEDQIIVSDGDTLWTYSKPTNRVLIDKLCETSELLLPRQILLQYTKKYQAILLDDEQLIEKLCKVIQFDDTMGEQYYQKITIWIDKSQWLPVQLIQEDANGNRDVFLLKSMEILDNIDNHIFKFHIPRGADVIRM